MGRHAPVCPMVRGSMERIVQGWNLPGLVLAEGDEECRKADGPGSVADDRQAERQLCALCRELPGGVRIYDEQGRELRICLRCDRLIQWQ